MLLEAHECAYSDTPRRIRLTDLAAAMGASKSTVNEPHHRAEGHLVDGYVEERPAERRPPARSS